MTDAMQRSSDPRAAFAAAERAFLEGRFAAARDVLTPLTAMGHPAVHHLSAVVEQALGDLEAARRQFEAALRLAPHDPRLWTNFGLLLKRLGDEAAALDAYDRALALAPGFIDAMFNRALLLSERGDLREARAAFAAVIDAQPNHPRSWNGLAAVERQQGDLAAAALAYDRALAVAPDDRLASMGRARVALEREEADVLDRYRAARRLAPENLELALDEIECRLGRGDQTALDELAVLARSAPDWSHGQIALARMRWEQGDRSGFADHIEALLAVEPGRAQLWRDYVQLLADCVQPTMAAEIAARAGRVWPADDALRLIEASQRGKAGQIDRAEELFAALPAELPGRAVHEAVHRIRRGELELAVRLIERALAEQPWDFASWGIAELLYRKLGDERSVWLSGQAGLVSVSELPLEPADFRAVDLLLASLHQNAVQTVGQSVDGGTQTRWRLFDRLEPEIGRLRAAVQRAVAAHWDGLPEEDECHPLLRHRQSVPRIGPSWSVRFVDAGHHVPHFHPKGLISSACYFRTPPGGGEHEGWLEIGRPPPDLHLDLDPIKTIEPKPGRLVLFPSYLFHGTRPFSVGERMSVAFDVGAEPHG